MSDTFSTYADNVSRILQQDAAQRGESLRQNGQIWGGLAQNIGQTIAGIPQQMQQQQLGKLQIAEAQGKVDAQTQTRKDMQALDTAFQQPGGRDAILSSVPGHLRPAISKSFAEGDKAAAEGNEAAANVDTIGKNYLVTAAREIQSHDYDPFAAQLAISHAKSQPFIRSNPAMLDSVIQLEKALQANPTADTVRSLVTPILQAHDAAEPAKFVSAGPGHQIYNDKTGTTVGAPVPEVKEVGQGGSLVQVGGTPTPPMAPPTMGGMATLPRVGGGPPAPPANGQPPSPSGSSVLFTAPEKPAPLESKDVLLDGKPAKVNFNARSGAYTDATGADVSSRIKPMPPGSVVYPNPQGEQAVKDVAESVKGMMDGTIPPILPSRASKEYVALMAEAHRQGADLVKMNQDWAATQKYLGTMNGNTQVRFRQAVKFAGDSVPLVRELAQQWDAGRFPLLNAANLTLAKNGAFGEKAASIATKLDAQIADMTSELGTVYKGGNSSTDESLKLSSQNLKSNWSKKVLLDNLDQIERNIAIRQNSIRLGTPIANEGNQYAPSQPAAVNTEATTTRPTNQTAPTVGSTVTFQGKRYRIKGIKNGQAQLEAVP